MSDSPLPPVLVAGAGPSGLVAALTLIRNNIPVRIIEKEPIHRIGQRGPGIFPRSLELFHFLGVPEINAVSTPFLLAQVYKPKSVEPLKSFHISPYTEPTPAFPIFNPRVIGQQTLEAILRSHLEKQGCFVELSSELRSFEQSDDRVVAHIIKKQGDEEIAETIEASFLVGTDGAKGVTRKQLGLSFLGETRDDLRLVMGDIRLVGKGIDRVHWHQFGEMAHCIRRDGFHYTILSPNSQVDLANLATDKDALFQMMRDLTASEFRPNVRMVDNFGKGRVFVAGGNYGLNSSVQDAFNLSWKLSLVYKGISPASLLSTYTTERIPVIAEMLNLTTVLLNKTIGRTEATIENAFERGQRLYMLGVNYRFSPIVLDEFSDAGPVDAYGLIQDGVLIAGDRAPDAPKLVSNDGKHTRFFDIFRPAHHTVLMFAPDTTSVTPIISALSQYQPGIVRPVVVLPSTAPSPNSTDITALVDEGGYAYGGYLVKNGETRVVIVRPDGVVGAIVAGEEGVKKYFNLVLAL
ncbi:hypothetical protein BJ138DRAFT_1137595 [Hygrophoropsis aurantiaca]|uniref:Uncharacterized protein n=1 Tax=Hygrophoropsis aurantiaca TaxID=72124 RepID=A0ACB8A1P2_9AGAM|nr:hypothetical protein BJ138DRAFT_1137595 [Hygrophoropsis aurantiaca]